MYQSVFLDAYIDKCAEVGDVSYDAGQFHAFAQVADGAHVLIKFKYFYRSAWVTSGLVQLLQDVFQCRHAHGGGEVAFRINLQTQLPAGYQFGYAAIQVLCHLFYDAIAFRVHGSVVQRVLCLRNA